jgi:hypothetical protein
VGETAPYLIPLPGGPAAFAVESGLASYGQGQSLDQAILTGIMSVAGLKGGHQLGETLANRARNPFTQFVGRTIRTGAGLSTVRAGTGQGIPDTPEAVAREIAMAVGFSFIGLKRKGSREKLEQIANNPETHPEVKAEISNILNATSQKVNLLKGLLSISNRPASGEDAPKNYDPMSNTRLAKSQ